ncbi:MAG: NupC/NupG family nucleoside CNT transporter [Acidobacteria bacterium]|nr:NupC/NupG family nucleoside CNT transporter [Acidobacteriota bacterium]
MARLSSLIGLVVILAIAFILSTDRKAIRVKTVAWGLGLQIAFALFVLKTEVGRWLFGTIGHGIETMLGYSVAGSSFVFGQLGLKNSHLGFYFAFQVLPTIIFIASFFAILYYYGIMQFVVKIFARVMTALLGASGAESLNVAASIFMGQTEAPLTIRPYLSQMTRSELMCVMTSGMAHISGGIMAAYIAFGIEARHLLTAVIMTAPGTILMSKMFVPETEVPKTAGKVSLEVEKTDVNVIAAAARGTGEGLNLAVNVGAILISFLALVALANGILGGLHNVLATRLNFTYFPGSLQQIFGYLFAPIAWAIGIPWKDCLTVGDLLGTRLALNELVAYSKLAPMKAWLDPKSFTIATFALCGFANISSIGIQIGGIGALAPDRKSDLARLGVRAVLAGTLANFMSATIAGMLL